MLQSLSVPSVNVTGVLNSLLGWHILESSGALLAMLFMNSLLNLFVIASCWSFRHAYCSL